jgi:hypothetical protein
MMRDVPWLADLRQRWDAANDWWNERVVRFDMGTQLDLLRWLGFDAPDWRLLGYLLAVGLIAWLMVIAWHVGRSARGAPEDRLARAYAKLCRKLEHAGVPREPHEGPLAYAATISARRQDIARPALALLMDYARLRYGDDVDERARPMAIAAFERAVARFHAPRLIAGSPATSLASAIAPGSAHRS